jgi:NAD(P)-dependent dehydrogenase (short-subunit alcohol dehydrogenase family)
MTAVIADPGRRGRMSDQRVALVVGGARGIGGAASRAFAESGHAVVVADLDDMEATALASRLDPAGQRTLAVAVDVTSRDSVDGMVSAVMARFGRLDALVDCAGIIDPRPSADVADDAWQRLLAVHVDGTFRCARAAYPALVASGGGTIVSIASVAAHVGIPGRLSYAAAKGAIEAMTRTLAVEWAPAGIRVNAVAPGYTSTELVQGAIDSGRLDPGAVIARTPLGRFAEPSEIASVILFLSTPASSFITGQSIVADGGLVISATW